MRSRASVPGLLSSGFLVLLRWSSLLHSGLRSKWKSWHILQILWDFGKSVLRRFGPPFLRAHISPLSLSAHRFIRFLRIVVFATPIR